MDDYINLINNEIQEKDDNIYEMDQFESIVVKDEEDNDSSSNSETFFYIPYKYSIKDCDNIDFKIKSTIFVRSSNGNSTKEISSTDYESFFLQNEKAVPKSSSSDLLKEFFSTTQIDYVEKTDRSSVFHISPYKNIPSSFKNDNQSRIIKLPKTVSNINKYVFKNRKFFDILSPTFQDLGPSESLSDEKIGNNPFYENFSQKSFINFLAFKTVIWSMINKDTLVYIFIDSSYRENFSSSDSASLHSFSPYSNINIVTSNFEINKYLIENSALEIITSNLKEKNINLNIKLLNTNSNIGEAEIFSSYIPTFISFLKNEADIVINYGESELNSVSKRIFNEISLIERIQNIDIEKFFKSFHPYYDNHSINKISTHMNFEENSTPLNKNIINWSVMNIRKLNENIKYGEEFLTEYLSSNFLNMELCLKNIENFIVQLSSRIIIITKIWINYSRDFFDLAHISNTNFNSDSEEIVKGIISNNFSVYFSSITKFVTNSFGNILKKNMFYDEGSVINVVAAIPYFIKEIERNGTDNTLSEFEKFFLELFKENVFLQKFYWIFFKFFDLYFEGREKGSFFKKCISEHTYKNVCDIITSNNKCIGLYKGMIYFSSPLSASSKEEYFYSHSSFPFSHLIPFHEDQIIDNWNFMLVLNTSDDSWIGVKFIYIEEESDGDIFSPSPSPLKRIKDDVYGYFGNNVVCNHPFSALKNFIEFYLSFFFSEKKFLNIDEHNLFKNNINFNMENTKMLKSITEFTQPLFSSDSINVNLKDTKIDENDIYSVWYSTKSSEPNEVRYSTKSSEVNKTNEGRRENQVKNNSSSGDEKKYYSLLFSNCDIKKYTDLCKRYLKHNIIYCIEGYLKEKEKENEKITIEDNKKKKLEIDNIKTPEKFIIKKKYT